MTCILLAGLAAADFVFQVDRIPATPEKHLAHDATVACGGCGANAAIAVARQGASAILAARLGDDPVSDIIVENLSGEGIDTSLVHRAPTGISSYSAIFVDAAGERLIMNFRGRNLAEDAAWLSKAAVPDAVMADTRWSPLTSRALALARSAGVPGVVDCEAPVDRAAVRDATHLAFSRQGLRDYAPAHSVEEALRKARTEFGAWICVTDGANGVFHTAGDAIAHIPAFRIAAVDTLAAGDVWHGVFALRLAEGDPEPDAIRYANAAAALKCLGFGGISACPDRAATLNFLKENPR